MAAACLAHSPDPMTPPQVTIRPAGPGDRAWVLDQAPRLHDFGPPPYRERAVMDRAVVASIDHALGGAEGARLGPERVSISRMARIITEAHKRWEEAAKLGPAIGSTQSGTGAAVMAMTARGAIDFPLHSVQADEVPELQPFLKDTTSEVRSLLSAGRRVVIEGTQGFGLSVLQGGYWPKATSRDTSAAGFLAEAGLSPRDVDDVTMVIRCHPIRVAGDSGPLSGETTWERIAADAGLPLDYREYTTVTKKTRRVGDFDPEIVRRAIAVNHPSRIVLNHLDYVDPRVRAAGLTAKARKFVENVEHDIGRQVDWLGTGPASAIERQSAERITI